MSILDTLRDAVQGDDKAYEYRCQRCDAQFESQTANMGKVDCPECGASKVMSAL